MTFFVES